MKDFPIENYLVGLVFGAALAATVGGALLAVLTTRIIRSVCGLAVSCVGLAGLYYFLHSPFLTLTEVLIYVGAICVTIIFAVMLAEPDEARAIVDLNKTSWWGMSAIVVSAAVFFGVAYLSLTHPWAAPAGRFNQGSVRDLGISLLTTYSLGFELISVVLVTAILGALVIAHHGRTKP